VREKKRRVEIARRRSFYMGVSARDAVLLLVPEEVMECLLWDE
jgi:hypothetical protein